MTKDQNKLDKPLVMQIGKDGGFDFRAATQEKIDKIKRTKVWHYTKDENGKIARKLGD